MIDNIIYIALLYTITIYIVIYIATLYYYTT